MSTLARDQEVLLDRLASELSEGNVTLFLGAGCSTDSGVPSGDELKKSILKAFPLLRKSHADIENLPLEIVADECVNLNRGREPLIDALELDRWNQFAPNQTQRILAQLCKEGVLQYIVTLNWDLLIEDAMKEFRVHSLKVIRRRSDMVGIGFRTLLLKAHGCITDQYHVVITSSDIRAWANSRIKLKVDSILCEQRPVFIGTSGNPIISATIMQVLGELDQIAYEPVWVDRGNLSVEPRRVLEKFKAADNHLQKPAAEFMSELQQLWVQKKLSSLRNRVEVEVLDRVFSDPIARTSISQKLHSVTKQLQALPTPKLDDYFKIFLGGIEEPYLPLSSNEEKLKMMLFWLAFILFAFERIKSSPSNPALCTKGFHLTSSHAKGLINVILVDCGYYSLSGLQTLFSITQVGPYFAKPWRKYLRPPHLLFIVSVSGLKDYYPGFTISGNKSNPDYEPLIISEREYYGMIANNRWAEVVSSIEKKVEEWSKK